MTILHACHFVFGLVLGFLLCTLFGVIVAALRDRGEG